MKTESSIKAAETLSFGLASANTSRSKFLLSFRTIGRPVFVHNSRKSVNCTFSQRLVKKIISFSFGLEFQNSCGRAAVLRRGWGGIRRNTRNVEKLQNWRWALSSRMIRSCRPSNWYICLKRKMAIFFQKVAWRKSHKMVDIYVNLSQEHVPYRMIFRSF